jgi:excinuclease ABC subunit A
LNNRLIVRGAREHNLRDVSLDLPRDAMIAFTGLSGSGKSSLAFDTIFAEGQRRYVESLSAYARQFLGQLDRPDVDSIEGLSPAVSIGQKPASRNPRSTVGTVTEVHDYLRLLWARLGQPHCRECGEPVTKQTPQQIVDAILALPEGTRLHLLAPLARPEPEWHEPARPEPARPELAGQESARQESARQESAEYADLFGELQAKGYARVRVDGRVYPLTEAPPLASHDEHTIEAVVDRLTARASSRPRITDSVETALRLGGGRVIVDLVDLPADDGGRILRYSERLSCPYDHPVALDELEPRSFSFNSPLGACPACTGLGRAMEVDSELVVPDGDRSEADGAIAPWSSGPDRAYFLRLLQGVAQAAGFDLDTPWDELPPRARQAVLHGTGLDGTGLDGTGLDGTGPDGTGLTGTGDQVHVSYRNRSGRQRSYDVTYEGAVPWIERRYAETEDGPGRDKYAGFMRAVPCPACGGTRLKPEIRGVTVHGRSIAELAALSIGAASRWLGGLALTPRESLIGERVLAEIQARLRFLADVGLDYLPLDQAAGTLAGGEAQRIRLATQIGSGLAGVLYVLDEPSNGLHQRDIRALIETLVRLKNLGNTLIVVEHDETTIAAADWVVDLGPQAGERGGQVVVSGTVEELRNSAESITGAYLSGRRRIEVPSVRRPRQPGRELVVEGAREHNLRDIDVTFPLGCFVAVTGVSGSGKSSLVSDILYPALAGRVNGARRPPGRHKRVTGAEQLDQVVGVDQSPIGRTPRSSPATYTGVFDHIRGLFAQTAEAKVRGYQPGRFSVNVKGGRCEHCAGDGTIKVEMNFLPDVYVSCEACGGARYNRDTLEVRYKGKTISEVLQLPIEEAAEFFAPVERIARHLRTLVQVGLGYVRLGQPATTLSGGEAQRVKLAAELQRRSTGATLYVLDEPTAGLHPEDVRKLLGILHALVDQGNTVLVIEHNLDVVKTADWVIDLGPDGGPAGGLVVAEGTPEQVAGVQASHTGRFLRSVLAPAAADRTPDSRPAWPEAA